MLTKDNFKQYVGYQEFEVSTGLAYMLSVVNDEADWVSGIGSMTVDEILGQLNQDIPRLTLTVNKYPVTCSMTLDQVLAVANAALLGFPTTTRTQAYAEILIAKNTWRGVGNKKLDNIVLYRGSTEYDACLVITKNKNRDEYGIIRQPKFENYGFVLQ